LILNGEMSEWSIEHAWKAGASRADCLTIVPARRQNRASTTNTSQLTRSEVLNLLDVLRKPKMVESRNSVWQNRRDRSSDLFEPPGRVFV
jgi:hypothetical protein